MPISPEDDARVAMVIRKECFIGDPSEGALTTRCDYCDAECWISPTTIQAGKNGYFDKLCCCHCSNTHDPMAMIERMLAAPGGAHFHNFDKGPCGCGMTVKQWMETPEQAREMHGVMQAIYERLRTDQ